MKFKSLSMQRNLPSITRPSVSKTRIVLPRKSLPVGVATVAAQHEREEPLSSAVFNPPLETGASIVAVSFDIVVPISHMLINDVGGGGPLFQKERSSGKEGEFTMATTTTRNSADEISTESDVAKLTLSESAGSGTSSGADTTTNDTTCGIARRQFIFEFNGGEHIVIASIMCMEKSYHVYLSTPGRSEQAGTGAGGHMLGNLSASMKTRYDHMPIVTQLINSDNAVNDEWGISIGQKLALRLNAQMFISCHLPSSYECIIQCLEQELIKTLSAAVVAI